MARIRVSQLSARCRCLRFVSLKLESNRVLQAGPVAIHMEAMRPDAPKRAQCHKEGVDCFYSTHPMQHSQSDFTAIKS